MIPPLEKTMFASFNSTVESAYIIRLEGNDASEGMAQRCANSCDSVGMPWKYHQAFDGTAGRMVVPRQYQDQRWLSWIRHNNESLSPAEVGCALSHISLWAHCLEIDQPIVILEHDAIMVQPYKWHQVRNSICYLGNEGQVTQLTINDRVLGDPPMPGHNHNIPTHNTVHIKQTHAYAIDPMMANRLLVEIIDRGIHDPVDVMMQNSQFCIMQIGLYAYQVTGESTIR